MAVGESSFVDRDGILVTTQTISLHIFSTVLVIGMLVILAGGASATPSPRPQSITSATAETLGGASGTEICDLSGDLERASQEGRVGDVRLAKPSELREINHSHAVREFGSVTALLALSDTTQDTRVGIVPPADARNVGWASRQGGGEVCLRGEQRAIWDGLMTHEYVHTRQEFSTADDMEWFIESSAFYYMAVVPYQRGTMSEERGNERLREPTRTDNSSDLDSLTLTDARSTHTLASYRGAPVLAALDHELRSRTDGERTLEHVFRAMTDERGPITYDDFQRIVADVAGERMDDWLDRYVAGSAVVTPDQSRVEGLTLTSPAATSDFQIDRLTTPSAQTPGPNPDTGRINVTVDSDTELRVTVRNDGRVRDTQRIALFRHVTEDDPSPLVAATETLAADGRATVSLSTDFTEGLGPGRHEVVVATADDEVRGQMYVETQGTPTVAGDTSDGRREDSISTENQDSPPRDSGSDQRVTGSGYFENELFLRVVSALALLAAAFLLGRAVSKL